MIMSTNSVQYGIYASSSYVTIRASTSTITGSIWGTGIFPAGLEHPHLSSITVNNTSGNVAALLKQAASIPSV